MKFFINKIFQSDLVNYSLITQFVYIHFSLHVSDLNYVEEIKGYTVSNHGRAVLVDQRNYTYNKDFKSGNRIFWCCSRKRPLKCKGRASTYGNYIMKLGGTHNHEPNPNVVNKMLSSEFDPLKKD